MNDWVFQCNPRRYDMEAAIAESLDEWWNTPRQRGQITVGDRVWLAIVEPFLDRAELLDDPILGKVSAFRGCQGSNRLIGPEAGKRLLELARVRLQPLRTVQPSGAEPADLDVGRAIDRHMFDVRARIKEEILKF